ncbi:MAG: hypothetical protein HQK53_07225 [Oligoflexia bacterium]|nr:hypothetical protein [Oligoflexia bacterium]
MSDQATQDLGVERKLSALESSFISSQPNMNIAAIEIEGNIDSEIMAQAITLLMQRYPSFRRNTDRKTAPFSWVEITQPAVFRTVESEDWKTVANNELRNHFTLGTNTHLWRSCLVKSPGNHLSNVLLFMYDHAIADGMSKVILLNTLLNCYVILSKGDHVTVNSLPAHLSVLESQLLTPSNANCKKNSQELNALLKEVDDHNRTWRSSLRASNQANNPACDSEPTSNYDDTNGFLCVDGDAKNLEALIKCSKQNNTTVGCTLLAAAAWSMAKLERLHSQQHGQQIVQQTNGQDAPTFTIDINMDVNERHRVSPSLGDEHVQLFISMLPQKIHIRYTDSFWASSLRIREYVTNKLPSTVNYQLALEHLENIGAPYWKADANFSSMGRHPFPSKYGDLVIKKMHHVGSKWSPFFGRFVFLSQSVSAIGYDLVYEQCDHDIAKHIMSMWSSLSENAANLNSSYTFADFLRTDEFFYKK